MRGRHYDNYHDQDQIWIKDDILRLRKGQGLYKDFGKTIKIWSESFRNYSMILISLFGLATPDLFAALTLFQGKIFQLSKVYKWQEVVFPMVIEVHTHILSLQPTDPLNWDIPSEFQGRFCNPSTLCGTSVQKP